MTIRKSLKNTFIIIIYLKIGKNSTLNFQYIIINLFTTT